MKSTTAIVICSGGIDSVTTAYYVKHKLHYKQIKILFFNYGQKTIAEERKCARHCAHQLNGEFKEININELKHLSFSLINKAGKSNNKNSLRDTKEESIQWYVPARNIIFISYSLAYAELILNKTKQKSDIFLGFKCEGKEHYPDTTPEFVSAMNKVAQTGLSEKFNIKAPLIKKDKEDIISLGKSLGIDFKYTWSCYQGKGKHCGICLACRLRKAGFYWAGIDDTTEYEK